jgi:hypothetical protein
VLPTQTVLFLYYLVFPLFCPSPAQLLCWSFTYSTVSS